MGEVRCSLRRQGVVAPAFLAGLDEVNLVGVGGLHTPEPGAVGSSLPIFFTAVVPLIPFGQLFIVA